MGEHTALPWRFDGDWYRIPTIFGADGKKVASVEKDERKATPERAANAAFIVKAVNNHERFERALKKIADQMLTKELELESEGDFEGAYDILIGIAREALSPASTPDLHGEGR